MAADGSIIIETKLDDADAQKELIKLSKKIDKMREELSEKQTQQSGIKSELEADQRTACRSTNTWHTARDKQPCFPLPLYGPLESL
jgi:peptidoglycan hydrolase CwlO-like protein